MKTWDIRQGDVLDRLREMPDESVHCVVTSPPYWSLRDYGVAGQIGLESTIDEWAARMVAVFEEVRRVLRSDGTLWLNLGDSYAGSWGARGRGNGCADPANSIASRQVRSANGTTGSGSLDRVPGLKAKDLIGQPWRVAFALQAAGWWLRSEIIWHKPHCLPESVSDRPTKSHEQIFLLTKSVRYFYDAEAIREPATGQAPGNRRPSSGAIADPVKMRTRNGVHQIAGCSTRNARDVWTIGTQPFAGAHFATFPIALPERCIRAGTSEHGACAECGAQWARIVEKGEPDEEFIRDRKTVGWKPTCKCGTDKVVRPVVLDPFSGAGTTVMVARRLNQRGIGIELNREYAAMSEARIRDDAPLLNHRAKGGLKS